MATVPQAAQILGVDKTTIYRWLRDGFLTGEQLTPGAPWQIRITQALRGKIRPDVPDGWLPLDQAAKVLGVARQTVLHKVRHGELNAVHVTSGRRKGLRIQVECDQPGLFDTSHETKGAVLTMADFAGDHADRAFGDAPGDAPSSALLKVLHRARLFASWPSRSTSVRGEVRGDGGDVSQSRWAGCFATGCGHL